MSLQVWLPLNGDLHNQGLSNIIVTNNGATVDNNGKIGKCYTTASSKYIAVALNTNILQPKAISFACWINISSWNSSYDAIMSIANGAGWAQSRATLSRNNTASTLTWNIADNSNSTRVNTITALSLNTWYHIATTYDGTNLKIYVNGILDNTAAATLSINYVSSLFIGGWSGNNYPANMKINDIRIYNHALSPKEVEEIAKGLVLWYQLSGETQIKVPSGYQQLEYIESTGTQYIDTGIVLTNNYRYRISFSLTSFTSNNASLAFVFGTYKSGNRYTIQSRNNQLWIQTGASSNIQISATLNTKYTVEATPSKAIINDVQYLTNDNFISGNTQSVQIFYESRYASNSQAFAKVYSASIYDGNNCVFYGIPAKRLSDNVLGMYDVITKTFFTNAGTGTFTAGPNTSITGIIYDSSGYSYNGAIGGSLKIETASPRYDVYMTNFGGANIIARSSPSSEVKTISFWIKTPNKSDQIAFVDNASGMAFGFYNSGNNILVIYGSWANTTYPSTNYAINTWNHICLVKGTSVDLYINGIKQTVSSYTNYWGNTVTNLNIGSRNGGTSLNAASGLSDFRMYVTALTAAQIKELYNTSMMVNANGTISPKGA